MILAHPSIIRSVDRACPRPRCHRREMPAEKENGLSQRGWSNVEAIMPKIAAAVEERQIKNNTNIDLSTAENWLIRSELIEICKDAINQKLAGQVSAFLEELQMIVPK